MKRMFVVSTISAALALMGCASPLKQDLSEIESNVDTASEGDFGRCMETLHAGAVELEKARAVLREGENISGSRYEEGLQASQNAVRHRNNAEDACYARLVAVEQQLKITQEALERRLQRTKEVLRGVTFARGSARLGPDARATLDVVANRLRRQPTMVEVQGHTSTTGTPEINRRLSQQRAEAVRSYLISRGVPANSITARGYGPTQPIASNETPEGRRANQRVELKYGAEIR